MENTKQTTQEERIQISKESLESGNNYGELVVKYDVSSGREFQYTNRAFHQRLEEAHMTQSMSRISHCIDNGPMEGFWGILKRKRYYGHRFTSKQELVDMIQDYILYYNTRRVQRKLGVLTPMEKHNRLLAA